MVKNKIKKSIAAIISAAAITAAAFGVCALSGCKIKTDHPAAQITIQFAEKTYTLDYKLYRNMYPQTVQHFIELADNGFYNGIIIHDYNSGGDWFTGGYKYDDISYRAYSANADQMAEYYSTYSLEEAYNALAKSKLTPTVFADSYKKEALNTLIGEFSKNQHSIDNGALSTDYGCLKMFYYEKSTTNKVYALHNIYDKHKTELAFADYKYNCATSLFTLQTGSSSSYSTDEYCVFATIDDEQSLRNLVDDVREYFEDNYGDNLSDYSVKVNAQVDVTESFSKDENDRAIEKDFTATRMPIVIKSVKITKY